MKREREREREGAKEKKTEWTFLWLEFIKRKELFFLVEFFVEFLVSYLISWSCCFLSYFLQAYFFLGRKCVFSKFPPLLLKKLFGTRWKKKRTYIQNTLKSIKCTKSLFVFTVLLQNSSQGVFWPEVKYVVKQDIWSELTAITDVRIDR